MSFASSSGAASLPDRRARRRRRCDVVKNTGSISVEIALGAHALHQHGAHHAAPADESYVLHDRLSFRCGRFVGSAEALTARSSSLERLRPPPSPISRWCRSSSCLRGDVAPCAGPRRAPCAPPLSMRAATSARAERVAEHHRHRQDLRQRIGHALAGDVGRRAVDRLVEALAVARRARPTAACRSSRSASRPRRRGCRRTCCR